MDLVFTERSLERYIMLLSENTSYESVPSGSVFSCFMLPVNKGILFCLKIPHTCHDAMLRVFVIDLKIVIVGQPYILG